MLKKIKKILNYIDSFDLGHPQTIPCNPNCLISREKKEIIIKIKK